MNHAKTNLLGQMSVFVGLLTFALTFFLLSRTPADADMWWHLRAGQVMWEEKRILLTDPFSFTRTGVPWVNAFWLAEIIFYLIYRLAGFFGIALFVALMGGVTFWLIYRRLTGNPLLNSAIILLAVLTAAPIWSPRPQLFSFFLLALLDKLLDDHRQGRFRKLWMLVPLFVLWVNLHGGWIWAFLLLIAYIIGSVMDMLFTKDLRNTEKWKDIRSLLLWTIVGALAIGLNPNGLAIWKLPFHTVDVSMQIQEWQSPDFHQISFHPLLWIIFLLIITGSLSGKQRSWATLLKLIGFAYLTFVSQRNIAPFAIIAAPILASWANTALEELLSTWQLEKIKVSSQEINPRIAALLNSFILVLLLTISIVRLAWLSTSDKVNKEYPLAAVQWIQMNRPEGQLFNSYNWGGYLTWTLPEYPVYIDGRADLYGNELISEWQSIVRGTAQGISSLDERNVNVVLLEPDQPLVKELEAGGWMTAFSDEISIVLIRK